MNIEYPSLDTPTAGALRFNTDSSQLEIYDGNHWVNVVGDSSRLHTGGTRGLFYRGHPNTDTIDYINISTTGDAIDFGNALSSNRQAGLLSSRTRAVALGRDSASDVLEYVTIAITGNATDFGDASVARAGAPSAISNGTRGVFAGGETPSLTNSMDYITIATTGNGLDFGDLSVIHSDGGRAESPTRGIIAGGRTSPSPYTAVIEFITTSTLGNGSDFGDLSAARNEIASDSNAVRGIFTGGSTPSNSDTIEYITIASLGNAIDFGNQSAASNSGRGSCSPTRFAYAFGNPDTSIIEYVEIMTTGNAKDFGDMTVNRGQAAAASNGHGGL